MIVLVVTGALVGGTVAASSAVAAPPGSRTPTSTVVLRPASPGPSGTAVVAVSSPRFGRVPLTAVPAGPGGLPSVPGVIAGSDPVLVRLPIETIPARVGDRVTVTRADGTTISVTLDTTAAASPAGVPFVLRWLHRQRVVLATAGDDPAITAWRLLSG